MGKARQLADAVNALSTGGLTFSGTGARIYGDFSNNTVLSRTLFQTTAINGITNVGVIPNGTATSARLSVFGSSDPTNASSLNILQVGNTESRINATRQGTGAYCPLTFYVNALEAARISLNGNMLVATATDDGANKLQVAGNVRFDSGAAETDFQLGPVGGYFYGSASTVGWYKAGGAHIRWDTATGNMITSGTVKTGGALGIGSTPVAPTIGYISLNIGPDSYATADIAGAPNTSLNISQTAVFTAGAWQYTESYKATCYVQNDGAHIFKFAPVGTAGAALTWTEAGRFTNTGKLQHMGLEFKVVVLGSVSGTVSIDLATANEFTATIAGATTFAFTNAPSGNFGQEVALRLTNPGAFTLTWPASTKYPGGTLGTLTAAGTDILKVRYDKTTSTYIVAALWKDVK